MAVDNLEERLAPHVSRLGQVSMRQLFADDPGRFDRYSLTLGDLLFDFSKNRIDEAGFAELAEVARQADVEAQRDAMFAGARVNTTEGRPVLHTALRMPTGSELVVDGVDVMHEIHQVLDRMRGFAKQVRGGEYQVTGGAVRNVVNIGIGGSDLGPAMASTALKPFCDGPQTHHVSNVDGADLADSLRALNPATTLFVVASKSFATSETMANAASARTWLAGALGEEAVAAHFVALSTNLGATADFGVSPDRVFGFWDWVGGRYSVWSAVGLSLMIAIGPDRFDAFLEGARQADKHFCNAPLAVNIPVVMAMLGIWHRNGWNHSAHAVLPYDQRLARFPAYLQQLDMESNGKTTTHNGGATASKTAPLIFGEPGTNGQHAFYQSLHQGSDVVPCDFLLAANPAGSMPGVDLVGHHDKLAANCLAQAEALMVGKTLEEVSGELRASGMGPAEIERLAPHKVFAGSRPSNLFLYPTLTPHMLGMLIALYEHKVFVQGVVWDINSFDQWGVELGKQLAERLEPAIVSGDKPAGQDVSTAGLINAYRRMRHIDDQGA